MYSIKLHKLTLIQISLFGIGGIILGLIYILIEHGVEKLFPFFNGSFAGLFIGITIGLLENFVLRPSSQQNSFVALLIFRVIIYMLCIASIILIIVTVSRSVRYHQSLLEAFTSKESQEYILGGKFKTAVLFTFIISLIANFTRLISLKIGRGNLVNFILGVYHRPRLVKRCFIFIQITNTSQLLKTNSIELYHEFLNTVYKEISLVVMNNHGYVYEYVDNQIIIYWNASKTNWKSSLLTCYQELMGIMKQKETYFMKQYNLCPDIICVAHGGEVVQAEIGELRTEIVFHGDVLNTAGRIMNVATENKSRFIISEYIYQKIGKTEFGDVTSIGQIELRGKQKPINLFCIN